MKNILVVDGNSILNRAFYGIRPLTTKSGKNTNAVFGMINILFRQIDAIRPDYCAVAFDVKAENFRKKVYEEYKAGRHETPPELLEQFPYAKECLSLLGIKVMELPGYEADDLLGTVSTLAESEIMGEPLHAYVLSGDRDLFQLISDNVTVLYAGNSDTLPFDRNAFFEKYGVEPSQFVDMKAIMGDASDNIPGVPGIGEKGAQKLIAAFGSLDGVYENINDPSITKGVRSKLESGKDSAYLSRFLAKIERNAPIPEALYDLAYNGIPDKTALYSFLSAMEFTAFIKKFKLAGEADNARESQKAAYREVDAVALLASVGDRFAVAPVGDTLYFAAESGNAFAYTGDLSAVAACFVADKHVVTHDVKALMHRLDKDGVAFLADYDDLMLAAYVADARDGTMTPEALAATLLGETVPTGAPVAHLYFSLLALLREKVAAIGDAAVRLLDEIEMPLARVLFKMERTGFKLDREGLAAFGEKLLEEIAISEERIYQMAGEAFNINSPKQLGEILFERLGLPHKKKTKSGYSTDADVLNALRTCHPIVGEILDYRQVTKLYSTYVVGLTKAVDENGRIHTDFKQALTATGRLSSAEPNLQNIPIRTKLGREMRRFFIPENENYVLCDADYSQIELRLLAAISGDDGMTHAFLSGEDIHRNTAATVFGVPVTAVPDELRKRAKAINFGIVYGIGSYSLSEDLGISVAEAGRYIKAYLESYKGVDAYLKAVVTDAEEHGYTDTLFGRRRYVPELSSQNFNLRGFGKRVAMNSPIQGTAADIMKIAMLRVDRRLAREGIDARLVMQVHDELIVEAHKSVADRAAAILKEEMEAAVSLAVPLTAEVAVGDSWYIKS